MAIEIIAEIGSNPVSYGWSFEPFAKAARNAGATHLKAQLFKAEHFQPAEWAEKFKLEFPRERLHDFADTAHAYGLRAGASVFDAEAVTLVARELDFIKLAAREQDNEELIMDCTSRGKPIYRSIDDPHKFRTAFEDLIITLGVVQKYPLGTFGGMRAVMAWSTLFKSWGVQSWGWSSHTTGWLDCWMAARLGASVVEKHLALSPNDIEARHSLLPAQFKKMVSKCQSH